MIFKDLLSREVAVTFLWQHMDYLEAKEARLFARFWNCGKLLDIEISLGTKDLSSARISDTPCVCVLLHVNWVYIAEVRRSHRNRSAQR